MENEILELLKKHLPSMQADVLISQLEEGKKSTALVRELKNKIEHNDEIIKSLNERINKQLDLDDLQKRISEREKSCEKREQQFEVELLKLQLSSKANETNNMFMLVSLLVKNPRAIEMIAGVQEQVLTTTQLGGCSTQYSQKAPFNSQKEIKETKED